MATESPGLRIGVVGVGSMGARHVETLLRAGADVVGIVDSDPVRAREVAHGVGARAYAGWEDLLDDCRPDAVVIATPPASHAGPAVAALERGVHVFVEKPLARAWTDATAIVRAAECSSAVCAVGYQWRATGCAEALADLLAGQDISLVIGRSLGPTRPRPWFLDRDQGGGVMLELASHDIDLHRAIAGDIVAVDAVASGVPLARSASTRPQTEDAVALTFQFASGAVGTATVAWTGEATPEVYFVDVVATEATLHLHLDPAFRLEGVSHGRPVSLNLEPHPSAVNLERFLRAAERGEPRSVFSSPLDAAEALRVTLACEDALSSGTRVEVGASTPAGPAEGAYP